MLQTLSQIISFFFAFVVGSLAYKSMNRPFRIIYLQVSVWLVFYCLMHGLIFEQQWQGYAPDNRWLMNIHLLLETTLLVSAAAGFMEKKRRRIWALTGWLIFILVFVLQVIVDGFFMYLNYADAVECIVVTILYSLLLYDFSGKFRGAWWRSAEIILCLGLLVYFACSVPYIAMMRYLQENYPFVSHFLFDFINNVLACLRYLFTAVAFWLVRRKVSLLTHRQ